MGPPEDTTDAVAVPSIEVAPVGRTVVPGHVPVSHGSSAARVVLKLFALLLVAAAIAAVTPQGRRLIQRVLPT